jgi:hypothetical protein
VTQTELIQYHLFSNLPEMHMGWFERAKKGLEYAEHVDFLMTWGLRIAGGLLALGGGKLIQKLFVKITNIPTDVRTTAWLISSGLIFWGLSAITNNWLRNRGGNGDENLTEAGPDLSLRWDKRQTWNGWDVIRLRNISDESAFNIGLTFSWPELKFAVPFEINVIHGREELEKEPQYLEKRNDGTPNVGRMSHILRSDRYANHQPLEVVLVFFDSRRVGFEKRFTLEAGPGSDWGEEIRIIPGRRKVSGR